MKIALIGNDFNQQFPVLSYGGIESCVENLAWGMFRRALDFFCVVPKRELVGEYPFPVIEAPVSPSSVSGAPPHRFVGRVKYMMLDQSPDVIWCQSYWAADELMTLGIPVICTFHDSCAKQEGWIKRADHVIYRFISQFQYDNWVREDWERACSCQIYTGLADEEYDFCGEKEDYFLWVAGLNWGWEAKGLPIFIALAQANPDKKFLAYGSGSERVAGMASRYAAEIPNFEFNGPLERGENHREAFKKARAYILPSLIPDTFPRTVLESLSKGTPVIASANGALPEMVGSCGTVSNDIKALNNALDARYEFEACFNRSRSFHVDQEVESLLAITRGLLRGRRCA
jgi:glycosyltransferase involved in cell wall biosynthesis